MELQLLWFHATTRQSLQGVKSEQSTAVRFTRRNKGMWATLHSSTLSLPIIQYTLGIRM